MNRKLVAPFNFNNWLKLTGPRRYSAQKNSNNDISKLRNIGILAHIDAGKTTTTERMLYYSGLIKSMGEVHHGNTVTDYMEQERERGITIKSAAVTIKWKNYQINIIDTPGHIDFTMEVEQTLNVLDGAIVILDGCSGVEAQTLTVWRQADRYRIPRIVYVNKMDRPTADFRKSCNSIEKKLHVPIVTLQMPLVIDSKFIGVVDILTMEKLLWNTKETYGKESLSEVADGTLWEQAKDIRNNVIDKLTTYEDDFANLVIAADTLDDIRTEDIITTLRKLTIEQKIVPVLCGSSYKNIGVQPLMDSILLYLPTPEQVHVNYRHFQENLSARAFKVIHDKQKGALVFFRIFSGCFIKGQKFYNIHKDVNEQSGRLYVAYADEYSDADVVVKGNVAVVAGLKNTTGGDLITSTATSFQKAKTIASKHSNGRDDNIETLFSLNTKIPEPVFFCSIEPPSLSYQTALDQALEELQREDPSLRVSQNTETGQTILAGMGELHLEIIKDRLLKEYKIDADLGPLQIAYRECPIRSAKTIHSIETKIGNAKQSVNITLSLLVSEKEVTRDLMILFDKTADAASNIAKIFPKHLSAIRQGIDIGLQNGPKLGTPVINVQIMLHHFEVGRGTSDTIISAVATQCVHKLLNESGTEALEPMMYLEIVVPEEYASSILADLARRRTSINSINIERGNKIIIANTPLSELLGYSTILRTLSSGTATFSMEFLHYSKMSQFDEQKAIESIRGF